MHQLLLRQDTVHAAFKKLEETGIFPFLYASIFFRVY
jgi:hypothetical protein